MKKSHPDMFFHGAPCIRCNGTERYKVSKRCRACNADLMRVQNQRRRELKVTKAVSEDRTIVESVKLYQSVLSMRWS